MIDGGNFFDQQTKNDLKTYGNIRKIATGKGDDYTTVYLLDDPYFKKYSKSIPKDFSKQQNLDTDPKAILQINFTGNLYRAEGAAMFLINGEAKETFFSKGAVKVLPFYFVLINY